MGFYPVPSSVGDVSVTDEDAFVLVNGAENIKRLVQTKHVSFVLTNVPSPLVSAGIRPPSGHAMNVMPTLYPC